MPELKQFEVKVGHLQKGDKIVAPFTSGNALVERLSRKQVWTTVTFATSDNTGAFTKRLRDEEMVTVERSTQTEAEKHADMLRFVHRQAAGIVADFRQVSFIDDLHAEIDKNAGYREVFDYSNLGSILKRQAKRKIGLELQQIAEKVLKIESITTDAEAFEVLATWYAEHVLNNSRWSSVTDPLSRSTATLDNLLDDIDAWAKATLLHDFRWQVGEYVKERATEIKVAWDEKNDN